MDKRKSRSPDPQIGQSSKRIKGDDIPAEDLEILKTILQRYARMAVHIATVNPTAAVAYFLPQFISAVSKTSIKDRFVHSLSVDDACEIVNDMAKEVKDQALESLTKGEWEMFLNLEQLSASAETQRVKQTPRSSWSSLEWELSAAREAWSRPFQGDSDRLLEECINSMNQNRLRVERYQAFTSIIQSSGMGKSRVVDEVAKRIFTLSFNLRDPKDKTGFPESDKPAATFFAQSDLWLHDESKIRFLIFFDSLFQSVVATLHHATVATPEAFAEWWHQFLSLHKRREFYEKARRDALSKHRMLFSQPITNALQAMPAGDIRTEMESLQKIMPDVVACAQSSAQQLIEAILVKTGRTTNSQSTTLDVCLLLNFDEAHCLHGVELTHILDLNGMLEFQTCSAYYALCSALDEFRSLDIFSLFLSTAPSLVQFSPPKKTWPSSRTREKYMDFQAPFTELPFDLCDSDKPLVTEGKHTLGEVCSAAFMVKFGRPLFACVFKNDSDIIKLAKHKILCGNISNTNSPISIRLLMEFEPRREAVLDMESDLVANHMRVVFSIPTHRLYMQTGTPSEPILAEAAAQIMYYDLGKGTTTSSRHCVLKEMQQWMQDGLLERGELGELVARMLLTFAHDLALEQMQQDLGQNQRPTFSAPIPVILFIQALFRPSHAKKILTSQPQNVADGATFQDAFKDAYIHFTHFGRTHATDVLTDEAALAAICRGMGWVFYRSQEGVDIGIPIFLGGKDGHLDTYGMTMMFFQIKNTEDAQNPRLDIDSHKFQFFTKPPDNLPDVRPYIFIVMNLGVGLKSQPFKVDVGLPKTRQPPESQAATTAKLHHRYFINACGCSPEIYHVIDNPTDKDIYAQLLTSRLMTSEHPRRDQFEAAVVNLKPFWQHSCDSFGWMKLSKKVNRPIGLKDKVPKMHERVTVKEGEVEDTE